MITGTYDIVMRMLQQLLAVVRLAWGKDAKLRKFADGQKHALREIERCMEGEENDEVYWFHAASLGEYNVIRPIIQQISLRAQRPKVVLTFFSPTGVEALTGNKQLPAFVDHVFYLPLDTKRNAARFLDIVKPKKAIFAVSEYWVNYLGELHRRQIPAYLVSACINADSALLKWYGKKFYREALLSYRAIMVLDSDSLKRLASIGINNVVKMGDPLFDTALSVASTPYHDEKIERFCASASSIFIAGSIHDMNDLQLVSAVANRHPDMKFIFVPHEIHANAMKLVRSHVTGRAMAYSEMAADDRLEEVQVLVIDFLGALSRIYRFGQYAYVGGGFTPYLHSVIEATVYGLPVAFGPNIQRKVTPRQLEALGIGRKVTTADELDSWLCRMKDMPDGGQSIRHKALQYARQNSGATRQVVDMITERS